MNDIAYQPQENPLEAQSVKAVPIPHVSIYCFCETDGVAHVVQAAAADRRMSKAHVNIQLGGINAAIEAFAHSPSPNLLLLETSAHRDAIMADLGKLAEVCDPGTKVIVVGHINDVVLYRELMASGVSEYVVAPFNQLQLMDTISRIYADPESAPVGRVFSFIGSKGGVGASTIAHNVAWAVSEYQSEDTVVADFDLAFGTAGLDFNQDPLQGMAEALENPEKVDDTYLERLVAKCAERLHLLAAPGAIDRTYNISAEAVDNVLDGLRSSMPCIIADVPSQWTDWSKQLLMSSDDIIIVAAPELASLRNTKNILDMLKAERQNDTPPRLVLNQVGMPKRPEIDVEEFSDALEMEPICVIPFDSQLFGNASNSGKMVLDMSPKSKASEAMRVLAQMMTGRAESAKPSKSILAPLLKKISRKEA